MVHETPGRHRRGESLERRCSRARRHPLRPLQIGLEGLDRYLDCRVDIRTPQLGAVEDHGVEPLRVLARTRRRRIGKHVTAVVAFDYADMAARVAWQPGVCGGMNVPGAHAITWPELRRRRSRAVELAAHHDALDILNGELAAPERFARSCRTAGGDLVGGDVALVDQQ